MRPASFEVTGLVANKRRWKRGLSCVPCHSTRRLRATSCVEGWSAIGEMGATFWRLSTRRACGPQMPRYVGFQCADDSLHQHRHGDGPCILRHCLALDWDGHPCHGKQVPSKLRMPTKRLQES